MLRARCTHHQSQAAAHHVGVTSPHNNPLPSIQNSAIISPYPFAVPAVPLPVSMGNLLEIPRVFRSVPSDMRRNLATPRCPRRKSAHCTDLSAKRNVLQAGNMVAFCTEALCAQTDNQKVSVTLSLSTCITNTSQRRLRDLNAPVVQLHQMRRCLCRSLRPAFRAHHLANQAVVTPAAARRQTSRAPAW